MQQANYTSSIENIPNLSSSSLPETSLLETIRDPKDPTRFLFLIWEG